MLVDAPRRNEFFRFKELRFLRLGFVPIISRLRWISDAAVGLNASPFARARLGTNGRARMFAATIAMTMTGADKERIHFKTNPAAKTTASDKFLHSKP